MNSLHKRLIALAATLLLAACASSSTSPSTQAPAKLATKTIQIISDPPGARIEVNDDYVGDAPLTITVQEEDGNFANVTTIRAIPTRQGDYVQSKYFSAGKYWGSPIPSRILFSLGLGPAPQ